MLRSLVEIAVVFQCRDIEQVIELPLDDARSSGAIGIVGKEQDSPRRSLGVALLNSVIDANGTKHRGRLPRARLALADREQQMPRCWPRCSR